MLLIEPESYLNEFYSKTNINGSWILGNKFILFNNDFKYIEIDIKGHFGLNRLEYINDILKNFADWNNYILDENSVLKLYKGDNFEEYYIYKNNSIKLSLKNTTSNKVENFSKYFLYLDDLPCYDKLKNSMIYDCDRKFTQTQRIKISNLNFLNSLLCIRDIKHFIAIMVENKDYKYSKNKYSKNNQFVCFTFPALRLQFRFLKNSFKSIINNLEEVFYEVCIVIRDQGYLIVINIYSNEDNEKIEEEEIEEDLKFKEEMRQNSEEEEDRDARESFNEYVRESIEDFYERNNSCWEEYFNKG